MAKTPTFYFPIGTVHGILASAWLSLFFGCLANIKTLFDLLLYRTAFFTIKDRTGQNRPKLLDKYGSHQFVQLKRQNIKLHYVESGSRDRQLMLFVHGFPECWFSWRGQIEEFSQNYHVVAVNMRGYGDSDKPEGVENYSFDILTADIVELIETLQAASSRNKPPKCILVAHDWGGLISWSVSQLRPDLVDRFIVLNAPHISAWKYRIATTWKQFFCSWYIFYFNIPFLPEFSFRANDLKVFDQIFAPHCKSPEEIEVYKHYFSQPNGFTSPLNYYRAVLRGFGSGEDHHVDFGSLVQANKIIKPKTLIVWGNKDIALSSELAEDSARICHNATVVYIEGASHWVQVERSKEVNEIVNKFLKEE